jgi:hypothetical protein
MNDSIKREHFAFLRSYWEQIKLLPSKKQKYEMFEAIMSVQFFENDINSISFSSQNQMILWEGLKPILKQSQKGYLDKTGLSSLNPKQGSPKPPTKHKDKEEDKDKELRERESIDNVFFSLTDHERTREANSFAEDISAGASNSEAYKVKIKKQINKQHPETLASFQEWYFTKTCAELTEKYAGKEIDDYKIESIHPYTDTKGYADSSDYEVNHLYYVQASDINGETKTWGADSFKEMSWLLGELTMEVPE